MCGWENVSALGSVHHGKALLVSAVLSRFILTCRLPEVFLSLAQSGSAWTSCEVPEFRCILAIAHLSIRPWFHTWWRCEQTRGRAMRVIRNQGNLVCKKKLEELGLLFAWKGEGWGMLTVFIQVTAAAAEGNKLLCMSAGEMGENKEHKLQQDRFMRETWGVNFLTARIVKS